MFQISREEAENLWEHFGDTNIHSKSRSMPCAFTEQGIYMLAAVLKGDLATKQSIFIMRAFREMRHYLQENHMFVTRDEFALLTGEFKGLKADVKNVNEKVDMLSENFILEKDLREYAIYKDQKFEADAAYIGIYSQAKKSIYVVDDYVNMKTLQLLSHKQNGVEVILFTENKKGRNGNLTRAEVNDFNVQYPTLILKPNPDCHDRFIVLDYGTEDEKIFHCGHSSKDAGRKICSITEFSKKELMHPMFDQYLNQTEVFL